MSAAGAYRTAVVGYEGGQEGRDALSLAIALVNHGEARVVAAHIYSGDSVLGTPGSNDWEQVLLDDAKLLLAGAGDDGLPAGVRLERRALSRGSAARGLHELAEDLNADLIVVGSTRQGTFGRILLGTTGESLLRAGPCAVAVAPRGFADREHDAIRRVAVGYDHSPEADAALRAAEGIALSAGGTLRVITVVEPPVPVGTGLGYGYAELLGLRDDDARGRLDEAMGGLDQRTRPEAVRRRGEPSSVLAEEAAADTDLLVVGSRGYGPLRRALLGSVSARLMRLAPCPVLVIPRGSAEVGAEAPDPTSLAASPTS